MKKIVSLILICTLLTSLVSCGKKESAYYVFYYTNPAKEGLIQKSVSISSDNKLEIISALLDAMSRKSNKKEELVIKPDFLNTPTFSFESHNVKLEFDNAYYDLDPTTEALYRTALVKTFCQIDGIDTVEFYINSSPLLIDGREPGRMKAEDYVDDTNSTGDSIEWSNVTLYYANKSGDKLIKCQRTLAHHSNVSLEKLVVDSLAKGPSQSGYYRTLPSDLKVLSVSVSDDICYINLSSEFISEMVNVQAEIPIYSLVNTVCSIEGIKGVKILVNGDTSVHYRESISLEKIFSFNDSIVDE